MSTPPWQPSDQPPGSADRFDILSPDPETTGLLTGLAAQAVIFLPEVDGCSVAADGPTGLRTLAHHGPIALALDALQHALGTGPTLAAVRHGAEAAVSDLAEDRRWAPFSHRAAGDAGASFVLALPLAAGPDLRAALTLYGTTPGDLDRLRLLALPLATHAAGILRLADEARQARSTVQDFSRAMSSRAVIDQAIGILMAQQRCSADDAFALLRRASQNRNIKLRVLSQDIVAGVGGLPRRTAGPEEAVPAE